MHPPCLDGRSERKFRVSRANELSWSVANELSGFMLHLGRDQGGIHETDKIATGATDVTF